MRYEEKVTNKVIVDISFTKKKKLLMAPFLLCHTWDVRCLAIYLFLLYLLRTNGKNTQKKHFPNGPIPLVSPILRTSLACHVWNFPIVYYIYIYIVYMFF